MNYDFEAQVGSWSHPPADHLNAYVSSRKVLDYDDQQFARFIRKMATERYGGWRNHNDLWVDTLIAGVAGKAVLDYGCGFGLETWSLVRAGGLVDVADIVGTNVVVASRAAALAGQAVTTGLVIERDWPFTTSDYRYDIFYCNGVLHHIPYAAEVMRRAWEITAPGGQARLMLYTDQAWREQIGTEPPADVTKDPNFDRWVRAMDQVGSYADWYSAEKVQRLFGRWWELEAWVPLTPWGRYAAAILRRKDGVS